MTGLNEVTLSLRFMGRAVLRIIRDRPGAPWEIPFEGLLQADDPKWFHFEIPLPKEADAVIGSRLRFELHSEDPVDVTKPVESILFEGYWGTRTPKKNNVSLGVVMCTFNNEELCLKNLDLIVRSGVLENEDIHLLLVDNASSLKDSLPAHKNIHYISQNNIGGAGGFTRGILEYVHESLSHLKRSHLLLMDDDISLEPEMILRIKRLHEYAVKDCVIGGAMFNLTDPCGLHEMGAYFSQEAPGSLTTDHARGHAQDPRVLYTLGRATEYDFAGWWFCSFTADAVREVGLPYSVFIRRDDVEYGERLKNSGRSIFCASGIGIWHAPFQTKPLTWMQYFDIRNDFIVYALSDTKRKWTTRQNAASVGHYVDELLLRFDYGRAELILLAIEDFLKGPEIIKNDPQATLQKVRKVHAQYAVKPPKNLAKMNHSRLHSCSKFSRYLKRITYNYQYGIVFRANHNHVVDQPDSHWKYVPKTANFVYVNHFWRTYQYFEKNPEACRPLIARKKKTLSRLVSEFDECSKKWKQARKDLSSVEFWNTYIASANTGQASEK
jgi:galactofuranosylgalactofuranosylrhamnosyl-N-acetylglucosaminyl-diphospho-decaprenol beta-1,5/1,6-galactofuranosyltransferase